MNYKQEAIDIVNSLSIDEKISQMTHKSKRLSRFGIDAYNWWNESLHGVARAGKATVFPQAIGLAAIFDEDVMFRIASAISDEVRAKYNETKLRYNSNQKRHPLYVQKIWYRGLTCWSPNINIFRDPRWGRGHETYGEDPYLTSRMGVAFVKGMQGDHETYLKTIATPKHFVVHSGPEQGRHSFDSITSKKDLYETYLPAFKQVVQEAKAFSIMSAYNAVNGIPVSMNKELLQDILRNEFGFEGYVVSDCGAISDIYRHHKKAPSKAHAAAYSVQAGTDLNCGNTYKHLKKAYKKGLISGADIDCSVTRLIEARFKLGMIGDVSDNPYDDISPDILCSKSHQELSLDASRKSLVLLKNDGILPLSRDVKILVIGPNADSIEILLGNYNGTPESTTTILEGIRKLSYQDVLYELGSELTRQNKKRVQKVIELSKEVDVVVNCIGLSPRIEGEEGDRFNSHIPAGDKLDLLLPKAQLELIHELDTIDTPIVTILVSGSALDLHKLSAQSHAIIQAFYPGQDGGLAVAELLYGIYSPSGRLPVTFVDRVEDLPHFHDYSMNNRTYKYSNKVPQYPFGYGLSYTYFTYTQLTMKEEINHYTISVSIQNSGNYDGIEVVQAYVSSDIKEYPNFKLVFFQHVELLKLEVKEISFNISKSQFAMYNEDGLEELRKGNYYLHIGGHQPDTKSEELTKQKTMMIKIVI